MANCAVVNKETNIVENVIVAAPTDAPPAGTFLVPVYQCDIGWQWVNDDVGFVPVEADSTLVGE